MAASASSASSKAIQIHDFVWNIEGKYYVFQYKVGLTTERMDQLNPILHDDEVTNLFSRKGDYVYTWIVSQPPQGKPPQGKDSLGEQAMIAFEEIEGADVVLKKQQKRVQESRDFVEWAGAIGQQTQASDDLEKELREEAKLLQAYREAKKTHRDLCTQLIRDIRTQLTTPSVGPRRRNVFYARRAMGTFELFTKHRNIITEVNEYPAKFETERIDEQPLVAGEMKVSLSILGELNVGFNLASGTYMGHIGFSEENVMEIGGILTPYFRELLTNASHPSEAASPVKKRSKAAATAAAAAASPSDLFSPVRLSTPERRILEEEYQQGKNPRVQFHNRPDTFITHKTDLEHIYETNTVDIYVFDSRPKANEFLPISKQIEAELDSIDENEKLIKHHQQKLKKNPSNAERIKTDIQFRNKNNEDRISHIRELQKPFNSNLWRPQEREIGRADREDFDELQSEANIKELENHLRALGREHEKIFASEPLDERKVKRLDEIETETIRLQHVLDEIKEGVFSPARHGAAAEGGRRLKRTSKGKKKKNKSTRRRKVKSR